MHRSLRSWLFVPADKPELVPKAFASGADCLILDLEDAVLPGRKELAREHAMRVLADERQIPIYVRINPLSSTPWGEDDLAAMIPRQPEGICLPKCESEADVLAVSDAIDRLERAGHSETTTQVLACVESPRAVLAATVIARAVDRVAGLLLGREDLFATLGAPADSLDPVASTFPRSMVAYAAAAAGVQSIDAVCPSLGDATALLDDARLGHTFGFTGKAAISPRQVATINEVFAPSAADLAWAEEIIAVAEGGGARSGDGALLHQGRLVDQAVVRRARRVLAHRPEAREDGEQR